VRFCDKVYVTLSSGGVNPTRLAFLWEGHNALEVCDSGWLKAQRDLFQGLFDRHLYDAAYGFLDGAQAACQPPPDPQLWLWMQSDLALTAARIGQSRSCLDHVQAAERSPAYAAASTTLRKALATNGDHCATSLRSVPAPYDYSWLRDLRRDPDQQFALDGRFNGLLSAAVPDIKVDDGQAFRDALKARIILPEGITFDGDRSVLLSGCMPHNCGEKAYIWVDLVAGKSIVAMDAMIAAGSQSQPGEFASLLALGSTSIVADEVPAGAWKALEWLEPGAQIRYAGPGGEWKEIKVPGKPESNH
jgi:hypothetical protein